MKAGVGSVETDELEAHFLAGGDLENTVHAVVVASRAGINLDFNLACAIDLAGRNVLEAVRTTVLPRVISCPDPSRSSKSVLSAVAKDGVELKIQAKVTVRTKIDYLIGGATEETIIARVGEGIISAVGSSSTHSDLLCRPEEISELIIGRGLDSNTAYQIVSIDVARIDVGENIGARIESTQAEADVRVSRAYSESRLAEAHATCQEMRAKLSERKAELVKAESLVPAALGNALRAGNLGPRLSLDDLLGGIASQSNAEGIST